MSQAAGAYIYQGPWINWSHGLIMGSTITLSTRNGAILIAFLALLVKFAGGQLWGIVKYVMHQTRASQSSRDGLHHQTQAILRNADSANQATLELLLAPIYWRKHAAKPFRRSIGLAMFPLLNLIAFGVAGIFSSQVSKAAGDEVLIRSDNCGLFEYGRSPNGEADLPAFRAKFLTDIMSGAVYARDCYGSDSNSPLRCNQYAQSQIKFDISSNATCPFSPGLCRHDVAAHQMDSGPIDSHLVLGINARPEDRITYRKVTTCAPIHSKDYLSVVNGTEEDGLIPGDVYEEYLYGPILDEPANFQQNYSYRFDRHTVSADIGYVLGLSTYTGGGFKIPGGASGWLPIPELNQTDSDISVLYLAANSILYDNNVTDPWFSANLPVVVGNTSFVQSDHYINPLACIDQNQFCNPNNGACTTLSSSTSASREAFATLGVNEAQVATLVRCTGIMPLLSMTGVVQGRGAAALLAQDVVYSLNSAALPDNQWTLEVESWFATGLAALQNVIVQFAAGPPHLANYGTGHVNKVNATDRVGMAACRNQKVRGQSLFQSFSALGVAVIVALTLLLTLVNLALPFAVLLVRRALATQDRWKDEQWRRYEKLQLLRMVFEARGAGTWSGGEDAVPVTALGETFVLVDRGAALGGGHAAPSEEVVGRGAAEEDGLMGGGEWKPVVLADVDEVSYRR